MNTKLIPKVKVLLLLASSLGLSSTLLAADNPPPNAPVTPTPPPDVPLVEILATDPTALIGTSSGAFTVIRAGSTDADLMVECAFSGTASNGVDYAKITTPLTIPKGFLAADVVIEPVSPPPSRGNKKVVLTLQTNDNYRLDKHRSASLTIVDDIYNDQPPTVSLTSPDDKAIFNLPAIVPLIAQAKDVDDKIQRLSFYADDLFLGRGTNDPTIPDQFALNWTNPPPGTYALFARAVDEVGKSTLSAPVHITVNADLPTVTINSPTEGQVFPIPAIVTIQADVKKGSGAITKVQFYGDHRLLEPLTKDPTKDSYSFDWKKVPAGSHTVMVRVTDEFGLRATATVNFKVENKPPVVTLVQPEKGKNFAAHADITLEANASDPDDAIKQVSFWANNRSLGSVSSSPYTLVWKNVPAGLYSLKATATDVNGLKSASIPVLISVSK